MKQVEVTVFGFDDNGVDAVKLGLQLFRKLGDALKFKFVDIRAGDMEDYDYIEGRLGRLKLPVTAINGKPRIQGEISYESTIEMINEVMQ